MFSEINLKNVKGVLLDLDNTLYEYEPCHQYALGYCYEKFKKISANITFDDFILAYKKAQKLVKVYLEKQGAGHSRFLYFQRMLEGIFGRTDIELTIKFEKLYWDSFFTKMFLSDGVIEFFKKCYAQGVKICLVTDLTAKVQFEKIKYLQIDQYIDFIVSSEEAGQEKPGSQIFKLALEKLDLLPQQVLMIGDNLKKDIEGAKKMNIRAVHIPSGKE